MQPKLDTSHLPPVPEWHKAGEFTDIVYEKCSDGIAKITINRPQVHNAFRPQTVMERILLLKRRRGDQGILNHSLPQPNRCSSRSPVTDPASKRGDECFQKNVYSFCDNA